jgi:hypothetical protein
LRSRSTIIRFSARSFSLAARAAAERASSAASLHLRARGGCGSRSGQRVGERVPGITAILHDAPWRGGLWWESSCSLLRCTLGRGGTHLGAVPLMGRASSTPPLPHLRKRSGEEQQSVGAAAPKCSHAA